MNKIKPILVTGSHRSGSTWVGKMISSSSYLAYIHEPFSLGCRPGICAADFNDWFTYIDKNQENLAYATALQNTLTFKYDIKAELKTVRTLKDMGRLMRDDFIFAKNRILKKIPLVKDPFAFFAAPWLAKRFDMNVLVLIRHPAAFVSSLKRMNWVFPFSHFLNQPKLMEKKLSLYRNEIEKFSKQEYDIIEPGCLLWNIIHSTILDYQKEYPHWLFIRHEDISCDPIKYFGIIFESFGLEFSKNVLNQIGIFSDISNPTEIKGKKYQLLKRNSAANVLTWKNRLISKEIDMIKEKVHNISCHFYDETDW